LAHDIELQTAGGGLIWIEYSMHPIYDEDGRIKYLVPEGRDITERKRAEEAVEEAREYAESIAETVREPLVVLDADLRVISANRSFCQTFKVTAEETQGQFIYDVGNRQWDIPRLRELLEKILPKNTAFNDFEVEHDFATIGRRIMLLNARRIYREANKTQMILLAIEDTTERKRAEEALQKAHDELEAKVAERTKELAQANVQLKEMDRLKSEFLATMSHELRTPLNSIIGFTGIILQGIPGELNEEQKKQLSMVYDSAKHLLGLINDILDLSRIESAKMEISTERFKIEDVVSEVAQSLSPMISQKGLRLITEVPDETPEIYSDRKKVFQILLNLVNNAVKFTPAGEVRIESKFDNDNLEVSVADTGVGIKKKDIKLLFEAFRQIDGTVQRRYQGAGLGLYLCQKLVTLLGGNIWAESEYGRGSKFTFTLPLRYEERGR